MQTPTTAEFNTAIEVLKKYAERLNEQATHSVIQMPESRLGVDYAARIQSQTIGQIGQIETVAAQVKTGGTKFFNNRIKPISVMFNPRHALLLDESRFPIPRHWHRQATRFPRHCHDGGREDFRYVSTLVPRQSRPVAGQLPATFQMFSTRFRL